MKTKMKKMILAMTAVVLLSANAVAFEDSLKVNEQKSFDLVLSDVSNSTQITLKDKHSNILYEQTINKGEGFSKTFNMELLAKGFYTIEIENETKVKVLTLEVNDNEVVSNLASTNEIYKPVVNGKGAIVSVSQFSPDEAPLYVAIYNNRNELIYEETLKGKMDLGKRFDFSKSLNGEYRFYLESKGKIYDQLVYVEK
jgi:hypothetical protein